MVFAVTFWSNIWGDAFLEARDLQGGGMEIFYLPDGLQMQMTVVRVPDPSGIIHIEGQGVQPTIRVPVNQQTLFSEADVVLEAAIAVLNAK